MGDLVKSLGKQAIRDIVRIQKRNSFWARWVVMVSLIGLSLAGFGVYWMLRDRSLWPLPIIIIPGLIGGIGFSWSFIRLMLLRRSKIALRKGRNVSVNIVKVTGETVSGNANWAGAAATWQTWHGFHLEYKDNRGVTYTGRTARIYNDIEKNYLIGLGSINAKAIGKSIVIVENLSDIYRKEPQDTPVLQKEIAKFQPQIKTSKIQPKVSDDQILILASMDYYRFSRFKVEILPTYEDEPSRIIELRDPILVKAMEFSNGHVYGLNINGNRLQLYSGAKENLENLKKVRAFYGV